MSRAAIAVRGSTDADAPWIAEVLARHWGGPLIIAGGGRIVDASLLPAMIAGEREGLGMFEPAGDRGTPNS